MSRQKLAPGKKKDKHLRVPLTPEQHQKVMDAAGDDGMAAWARAILIDAADAKLSKTAKRGR